MMVRILVVGIVLVVCVGCAQSSAKPSYEVEYYRPAIRQLPPDPVYSRLMWSHLPKPVPEGYEKNVPFLQPVIEIELVNSTLGEAVAAVSQTLGYEGLVPAALAKRPVSLKMVGTLSELLAAIEEQAGVEAELSYSRRVLRVKEGAPRPNLPGI